MSHLFAAQKTSLVSLALLLTSPVLSWAAAPSISAVAPVDLYFNVSSPGDDQFGYRIVATGSPALFDATGLPPDATLDRATGWISGSRNRPGVYDVAVRATNADGVGTATVRLAIHPAATGLKSSQGVFRAGQSFTFTVRYNTTVTVTGIPHLALAVGPSASPVFKVASYVSGSGTNELVFQYLVTTDDVASDSVRLLPSAPAGGAICDASGLTASPSLPMRHFASGITIAMVAGR